MARVKKLKAALGRGGRTIKKDINKYFSEEAIIERRDKKLASLEFKVKEATLKKKLRVLKGTKRKDKMKIF